MELISLWSSKDNIVRGESCMFAPGRSAKLLFPAKRIIQVLQPQTKQVFQEGVDYKFTPGTDLIELTDNSGIPSIPASEMYRKLEDSILYPLPGNNAVEGGPNGCCLRFDNADFFARHQVEIDYEAANLDFPDVLCRQADRLPRTRARLTQGLPMTIALVGDSIGEGFNATKFVNTPPYNPCWFEQLATYLKFHFDCPMTFKNFAVDGTDVPYAISIREKWEKYPANLQVVHYCLNDICTGVSPETFVANLQKLIDIKLAQAPDTEFIFASPMCGNPEWAPLPMDRMILFHEAIVDFVKNAGEHVALANIHSVWQEVMARKGFNSLTGNGVNHPNDYTHRLYLSIFQNLLG